MRLFFQNEATEAEIKAAKEKVKPAGKAKSIPKAAAAKGKAVAPMQKQPPPTPESEKKSPNPAPTKRFKGKQPQKDSEDIIKELQEAVNMVKLKSFSMYNIICNVFFSISMVYRSMFVTWYRHVRGKQEDAN